MAARGIASRREADRLIALGKVFVNGKKAVLGERVKETDEITLNRPKNFSYAYYAYHKPAGIVTTNKSEGEKDIVDTLHLPENVVPQGRLDKDSTGLILLSNDGRITKPLLEPSFYHEKEYEVTVDKDIREGDLRKLARGVDIGDYTTRPAVVKRINTDKFSIILTEGKNRQIRRMCEKLNYHVSSLKRIRVMNIKLGTLKPGALRKLTSPELKTFLKSLGL